ncbi:MAG TPA: inositol monophosphatase family protein [Paenalcaligenes sp.]|nr:inositol monophosphatase family protein [Paenalcaligenes sp.]
MNAMLNTALRAARRAGQVINRASLRIERLYVDKKGPKDYVTEVDREAEQIIIDTLQQAYPDHDILAEESGLVRALSAQTSGDSQLAREGADIDTGSSVDTTAAPAEYQWVIDPLDGTTNFIHGFPNYAISIGLLHRQQLAHALIFDPVRNELFYASRGEGAFLNDRRVRVSQQRHYHEALLGAHVAGSGGGMRADSPFAAMLSDCTAVRRTGSVVLDLAYVACGRLDGFVGVNLKPWDMVAGALLVLEAGGLVGDFAGEQDWLQTGNILAATPKVFGRMVAYL